MWNRKSPMTKGEPQRSIRERWVAESSSIRYFATSVVVNGARKSSNSITNAEASRPIPSEYSEVSARNVETWLMDNDPRPTGLDFVENASTAPRKSFSL
nr:hypothetical protein [uncultured bacterium]